MRRSVALAALGLGLAVAGCGGGEDRSPGATAPAEPQAPTTAEPPRQPTEGAPAPAPPEEDAAPGGSQRARVPATFRLRGGRLSPSTVSIPPFLAIEVSVASAADAATVIIAADRRYRLRVPAGGRAGLTLPGQPAGRYAVTAGRARAFLVVGGEPGP